MGNAVIMDYYSDEIFSVPAGEVVARASADGKTWVLLSYLQEWCSNNSFCPRGVRVLIEVYRTLGCHANCWFLSEKYLPAPRPAERGNSACAVALGLDIGITIDQMSTRVEVVHAENMWVERDLILRELKNVPQSLSHWLELAGKYVELEELLMAVMTLFLVRMNALASEATWAALRELLHLIRIYGTCGCIWAFIAEDTFLSKAGQILTSDRPREEIADFIGKLFASCFNVSLNRDDLLRPFAWPN